MLISCSQHIYTTGFTVQTHSIKRAPSNPSHMSTANKGSSQAFIYQRLYFAMHCLKKTEKAKMASAPPCLQSRQALCKKCMNPSKIINLLNDQLMDTKPQKTTKLSEAQTEEQQGSLSGKEKRCYTSAVRSRPTTQFWCHTDI